ncbi:WD repeat-containing protein 26 homolog [Bidens hawaiensis]|uniref:WD repeat-containing protein 26 homolog n=1 Tax=Bidens hawaiensis TaxID=980011 RepID=UPI00404B6C4E
MGGREINQTELVRLLGESLHHLGYQESYRCLLEESNIPFCSPELSKFLEFGLDGNWDANDKYQEVVDTLRKKITPLLIEESRVGELSSVIIQRGDSHIKPKPNSELLETSRSMFPHDVVVPRERLLQLVEQTLEDTFIDNTGEKTRFPTHTSQILKEHTEEVYSFLFSNDKGLLASDSKDIITINWADVNNNNCNNLSRRHTLQGHGAPICSLSWSPDDQRLLTYGLQEDMRCWDIIFSTCISVYRFSIAIKMISCHWCPDGQKFLTGITSGTIVFGIWWGHKSIIEGNKPFQTVKISRLQGTDGKSSHFPVKTP